jgi:hypothetical protein
MAKVVLGKTPEQLEAERAKKEREQEAEIQASILERQKKIQALHSKQKTNKIIITLGVIAVAGILITFGTYNTFFKKGLTLDDVNNVVGQAIYCDVFPSDGLDGYIRDNCDELFMKYYNDNKANQGKDIQSVEVDSDSCYIFKVKKLSPTLAQVYFSVDIVTTKNDVVVTDPTLIEKLKRSGFGADLSTSVEQSSGTTTSEPQGEVATEVTVTEAPYIETTETTAPTETNANVQPAGDTNEAAAPAEGETTETTGAPAPTEATPTEATPEETTTESDIPNTSMDYQVSKTGEAKHYYMTENGVIMQSGDVIRERYSFYVPVQLAYQYDADGVTVVTTGYAVVDEMNLYSLVETNMTDFSEITVDPVFAFDEATILDEDTTNMMQTKVNNTLRALYDGTIDTSQDFQNFRQFNNYNATFVEINEFKAYSQPNALGYNVRVSYSIITAQGFKYTLETYMLVEQNGETWVIKEFM